jgi:hypothetical protein
MHLAKNVAPVSAVRCGFEISVHRTDANRGTGIRTK